MMDRMLLERLQIINEQRDAIKPGASQEYHDYCNKIRDDILETMINEYGILKTLGIRGG